jgi:hypothetical protein
MPTRWYNPRLPQTLVISQFLLYFNAAFAVLGILLGGGVGWLGLVLLAGWVYGGWGIANERKSGYKVAVAVSFAPLALRALIATNADGGIFGNLSWVLLQTGGRDSNLSGSILDVVFQYALIGLLLHQQSREHQKIWFE